MAISKNYLLISTIVFCLLVEVIVVSSQEVFSTTTFRTTTLDHSDLDATAQKFNKTVEGNTIDVTNSNASVSTARGLLTSLLGVNGSTIALDNLREAFFRNIKIGRKFSPKDCMLCRFSASILQYAIQTNRGKKKVQDIATTICINAKYETEDVCTSIAKTFVGEVSKVLAYALFTPDQICGILSDNSCGHVYDPFGDWTVSLEASEHLDIDMVHQYGIDEKLHQLDRKNNEQLTHYKVIHISDTHVDLNYVEGSISNCEEPLCCQASSTKFTGTLNHIDNIIDNSGPTFNSDKFRVVDQGEKAGHWGAYSKCDIPVRTFEQLLMNLNETIKTQHDIAYIVWTGDIQPHDVWKQSNESASRTFDTVFQLINKYLPNIKIFPTLGNHEMVPVDSFSPSNLWNIAEEDAPKWIYEKFDRFWSKWLPHSTESTILRDGNYAATVRPGLKIISLNTNYCHDKNFWLFINSTDPGNQLQWLVHELQISEILKEKVHIIGHIPPGADDCLKIWSRNFNRILRRYKNTVTSQFYGHTHFNEFQLFYDVVKSDVDNNIALTNQSDYINAPIVANSEPTNEELQDVALLKSVEPISVGFIAPSVTTFTGLNPSYRIYTIDPMQGFMPIDFDTYYLNLTAANDLSRRINVTRNLPIKEKNPKSTPINSKLIQKITDGTIHLSWVHGGSFARTFNIPDIRPENMHKLIIGMSKRIYIKEKVSETIKRLMTRVSEEEDHKHNWKKEVEKDDSLYKLYRLYNSYSDVFGADQFSKCDNNCRKEFLCRYLTGESHNSTMCLKYII